MTTRTDRQIAARRAAAPSVDFSLLPNSPAMDALRALAAEEGIDVADEPVEPPPPPPPPTIRAQSPVAGRFAYRARPKGDRTLQPMDAPMARALQAPQQSRDAASAFVAAHLGSEEPTPVPRSDRYRRRQSEIPTVILESTRRTASRTLEPIREPVNEQVSDEPTAPPRRGGNRRSQRLDTDLLDWIADEPTTLSGAIPVDDDVDPELDAWLRRQGQRRAMALVGALTAMVALCAAALAGLVVMAGPIFPSEAPPPAPVTEAPPPPAPHPLVRTLTVERGDTFARLLAGQPVDALAVHAAALPLYDLARLEIGDIVVVELDPAGEAVREVRYDIDGGDMLSVRKGAEGWTATLE